VGSKNRHSWLLQSLATVVCVICTAGVAIAPGVPASADPRGDAREASRRADRAEAILESATVQARAAARRLEAATAALPVARHKVATSRGLVVAARVAANTARREATTARAEYDAVAQRFQSAQQRVHEVRERVDDIASATYMGANFGALNMLAGATGPRDAMDRLDLMDQVMQKQQSAVVEITAARRQVRIEQDQAGLAKRTAEAAERDATGKLAAARDAQEAAEDAQEAVIALADTREQAMAVARSQRTAVLATYRRARAEEARIQSALRAWQQKGGTPTAAMLGGGTLFMPVNGWKSSDYGERYDPYYRVWQLHAGTDFAAPGGTPIRAAADGRVLNAGWSGGYGNYTCVGHGMYRSQSFSTCYGHQSVIGVHVGEYVRRGEIIGRVGTTGASTGYHLHFETRFNGVPRNPLPFLPSCLC
jgi:murein DD-endopeptidase MepM/ murein hydrolase activator NlpD